MESRVDTFGIRYPRQPHSSPKVVKRLSADGRGGAMPCDNDRYWKGGIFYMNPDDPAPFLPERFGIGWTINLGRPAAWAFMVGFALVIAGFIAASLLLT